MARSLTMFKLEWHQEVPRQIHSREVDKGGAPQWSPEFAKWITRDDKPDGQKRNPDGRLRLTRAMRSLRKEAPRQYEVFYRIMCLDDSVEATTAWLNNRAIRGGHPERYRLGDTLAILQSSVDYVEHHY